MPIYKWFWLNAKIRRFLSRISKFACGERIDVIFCLRRKPANFYHPIWWWEHFDYICHVGGSHICHVLLALQWMLEVSLSCQSDHQLDSNVEYRSCSGAINEVHLNCTNGSPSPVPPIGHAICLHSTLSQATHCHKHKYNPTIQPSV